jgi:hypothetical protein
LLFIPRRPGDNPAGLHAGSLFPINSLKGKSFQESSFCGKVTGATGPSGPCAPIAAFDWFDQWARPTNRYLLAARFGSLRAAWI